jgi:uncharacterized protein (TIGR02466 family)
MNNFEILPLFPSVVSATRVTEDITNLWNDIPKIDFFESTADDTHLVFSSRNMKILEEYPDIKNIMLGYFYQFKNNVLRLDTTDFKITTSWMTKTEPGGFCQYHCHRNSYYSAVLYQKSNTNDSGNLLFTDSGVKEETILVNDPFEDNIYNTRRVIFEPAENLLLFFPSNLRHRISKYTGEGNRYSLAFNLFPTGKIGNGDSTIEL